MLTQYKSKTSEEQQKPMRKIKRNPPRRHIILNPAELAASFAKVVTTPSEMADDWVARNGDKSIFSAFRNVLPEVSAPPQHFQRRLGCEGRVCVRPSSLLQAAASHNLPVNKVIDHKLKVNHRTPNFAIVFKVVVT